MRKRWLWLLAAVMVGACACGGGNEKDKTQAFEQESSRTEGEGETEHPGDEDRESETSKEGSRETKSEEDADNSQAEEGQEYGDFQTGVWDGLTFINLWMKVTVAFPEGTSVLSEEDMRKMVGNSSEILVNSGNYEDIRDKVPKALNIYDFMVTLPDGRSSVQLAYMNAEKAAPGQALSAADCLEGMAEELSAIQDMGYEISELKKKDMGGHTFDWLSASLMGGALYQEYYAVRMGDYVAVMTISCDENGRALAEEILEGIRAIP